MRNLYYGHLWHHKDGVTTQQGVSKRLSGSFGNSLLSSDIEAVHKMHVASRRLRAIVDNPYEVRGLHNLRIAAKRLLYALEILKMSYLLLGQVIANELAQMQDELVALHDSDVLIALLRLCMGGEDAGIDYELALVNAGKNQKAKANYS